MSAIKFHINTKPLQNFSKVLTDLHKSALPIAIRGTLNDMAFKMKTVEIAKSTASTFTIRQKNFFKANSKFDPATGFDVKKMVATVGMYDDKLKKLGGGKNFAVSELEQQEKGGNINHKTFIGMRRARSGTGLIKSKYRYSDIKDKIISSKRGGLSARSGRSKKQQFIRAAIMAKKLNGDDAFILGNKNTKGSRTIFKIERLFINKGQYTFPGQATHRHSKIDIKVVPIYTVKSGRIVSVKQTNFMKRAALGSAVMGEEFFFKQAQRQLAKYTNKPL